MPIPYFGNPQPQQAFVPPGAMPAGMMPPVNYAQQPYPQQPASTGWHAMPAPASSPVLAAQASTTNQPKVRGYAPEALKMPPAQPRSLRLPSPEELGLTTQRPAGMMVLPATTPVPASQAAVDWNQTHARLRQMGAIGFHLDHLSGGITRVTLLLPTENQGRSRQVEAVAGTEVEAIAAALERAESMRDR